MSASQQAPPQSGEVDSMAQRIMELLAPVKEQVVRGILARFPMRGLEQIIRETFDSAIVENLGVFSSFLNPTPQGCGGEAGEPKPQAKQEDQLKAAMLEAKDFLKAPTQESEEMSESLKEDISRLKREIDRLILELKVRDRKIREQERLLEKMRALAENGLIAPVLEGPPSTADPELLSFWKRICDFLEKEPKFKILRLLVSMKELTLEGICQSVGVQKQLVARCLEEMKDADLIKVTGDSVTLKI